MSSLITSPYSRKNPFPSLLRTNRRLTKEDSAKETRHYEVSIAGSGLIYEVGDSLGVFPQNDPLLVQEILERLGFSGEELVPDPNGEIRPIRDTLLRHYAITEPSKQFLAAIAEKDAAASHFTMFSTPEAKEHLEKYLWGREVIDPLLEHPQVHFTPEEFVKLLRKLQPRLYSIASSPKVYPEEIHLTVATVQYESLGRERLGVCSTFLAHRVTQEIPVSVFIHSAKHFRLPEDPNRHVIMVGPGTGIAPFRAFLQERRAIGAPGKHWLFFGDQRAKTDFLYQEELETMHQEGTLHLFHTAFSRDQEQKIYVQHRMLEEAKELYSWLEEGAYFYVCGDASRMAKDVEQALQKTIELAGGKSPEEALTYVEAMKKEKRYRKDVY
ncbi:MAG: sulfite reductase subunit alpha [Verrucomicrobiae bacterium]|jgi:sulfite reductase (NADPH) flavoprotein alpha-component|nr:sulfite reductase subunit alpha [Verrucomicrobiae bacterium]